MSRKGLRTGGVARFIWQWLKSAANRHTGLALLVLMCGCSSAKWKEPAPSAKVTSIGRGDQKPNGKITPAELEAEIMRFADELTAMIAPAADDYGDHVGTPEARALALNWKTGAGNNSLIIASGANATANLLDMVVYVTLVRMTFEEYWVPRLGPPAQPMLNAIRKLEEEIWSVAGRVLTPQQQKELRDMIRKWRAANPDQVEVGLRFRDFANVAAGKAGSAKGQWGSVLSVFSLDPFAGLDPATREMEQTRYFADRALYVLKRMPSLLRWQSELFVAETLANSDIRQVLTNLTLVARSTDQLPERMSAETRKLMTDFNAQVPQWQALLTQFQQSFQAGNEMASSVNAATKSLDAFVGRYTAPRSADSGATSPSAAAGSETDTNATATARPTSTAKRFDVTEYGAAAAQIGAAAQQLNTLVASMDKVTPQLSATVEHTGMQGKELVDYAFRRALWLVGLTLIGIVVAMLAYRFFASRLFKTEV